VYEESEKQTDKDKATPKKPPFPYHTDLQTHMIAKQPPKMYGKNVGKIPE